MNKYVVMPAGLAIGFERSHLTDDLKWGISLREQEGVPQRRALFSHSFDAEQIVAIEAIIILNPSVELVDEIPSDWRSSDLE